MVVDLLERDINKEFKIKINNNGHIEVASYGSVKNGITINLIRIISAVTLNVSICNHKLNLKDVFIKLCLENNVIKIYSYEVTDISIIEKEATLKVISNSCIHLYNNYDVSLIKTIGHTAIYSSRLFKEDDDSFEKIYNNLDDIINEFIMLREHLKREESDD